MAGSPNPIRIGTAGWSIPKEHASAFPVEGSHLERYGAVLDAVEINSSFYRPHRRATYERWAEAVPERFRSLPGAILHGPAVAARLSGVADPELCDALRYHTLGWAGFGRLGKALYLADFLAPGRDFEREWRASLAARMPAEMDEVLVEVLGARIRNLVDRRRPVSPETAAFWSAAVGKER